MELEYCHTMKQVADIFTKPLSIEPFRRLKEMLGMKHFDLRGCVGISNKNVFMTLILEEEEGEEMKSHHQFGVIIN